MCGICGIVNFDGNSASEMELRQMMQAMKHRGPDDEGVFTEENIGLGFVRLSIIDLSSAGHQPMFKAGKTSDDNRYGIVFNGEIYNYIELRQELKSLGHTFNTHSDTEVLLSAYIEWGEACLDKLNGMWAFAIYDRLTKSLFMARDRFGIKPFYYYLDDQRLVFASEIPSILKVLGKKVHQNDQSIFDYLVFNRIDQTEATFFKEIKKLPHAYILKYHAKKLEIKRWYNLSEHIDQPFNQPGEFRELLSSSIGLRLRSDVPIGVCLSGGLDSSSIVSLLLNDHKSHNLNTFSAVYGGDHVNAGREWKVDETSYIKEFEGQVKNMHYITPTAQSLFTDLNSFIRAHAEPVSSTAPYAQYKVMELARQFVVVTLDGQGADEQLAGYHYFFGVLFKELFYQMHWLKMVKEMAAYRNKHQSNFALKMFAFFMLPASLKTRLRTSTRAYINPQFQYAFRNQDNLIAEVLYGSNTLKESLVNHFEYKLEHLLKWEDRNSMHFSIEARVPFLDYRLVEKTLAMNSSAKISEGITKRILRDSMKSYLPERIFSRKDEVGFDTPEDVWFRTPEFKELISDTIHSSSFISRPYFNPKVVQSQFEGHLNSKSNISRDIWKWLNLELWLKEYID